MNFPVVPDTTQGYDLSGLLVLAVPPDADRYLLLDALMTFVENAVEALDEAPALASERVAWIEVRPDEFELNCAVCVGAAGRGMLVHAVLTEGKLAVFADALALDTTDWDRLITCLCAARAGGGGDQDWHVLQRPATGRVSKRVRPLARLWADRLLPIRASIEQRAQLAVSREMPGGRHPVIAMRPIHLTKPDQEALRATFETLQERHEILHMTFPVVNGQDYICLTDSMKIPFEIDVCPDPLDDLEGIGLAHSMALSRQGFENLLPWRARLVMHGDKGVLCCVFSEAITDLQSAEILRTEIIQFYKRFLSGANPEARWPEPAFHYTDYAAAEHERPKHQLTPLGAVSRREADALTSDLAYAAPVMRTIQDLKPDMQKRLESFALRHGIALRTVILDAFLATLNDVTNTWPSWIQIAIHDRRPIGAGLVPGPFSMDCLMWLGSDSAHCDLVKLQARLSRVLAQDGSTLEDTDSQAPALMRNTRIYRYDGAGSLRVLPPTFARAAVSLSLIRTDTELLLEWLIREDDPLSRNPDILIRSLSKQINAILETDCS
ncbi:MAG: hypothetical protein JJU08_14985 [Rhodobacteraceae bacterium]|nr:hypothetical protein [Paracoccaceae bacterium]